MSVGSSVPVLYPVKGHGWDGGKGGRGHMSDVENTQDLFVPLPPNLSLLGKG